VAVLVDVRCIGLRAADRAARKALTLKGVTVLHQQGSKQAAAAADGGALVPAGLKDAAPKSRAGGDMTVDSLVEALSTNPQFVSALATRLGIDLPANPLTLDKGPPILLPSAAAYVHAAGWSCRRLHEVSLR
jgi:hypothetical protein